MDGGILFFVSIVEVDIIIMDINDNFFIFSLIIVIVKVNEMLNISSVLYFVYVIDVDVGVNVWLMYFIFFGNGDFWFFVDFNNGKVFFWNLLDCEVVGLYIFSIIVVDVGSLVKMGSLILSIEVMDVNDNFLYFIGEFYLIIFGWVSLVGIYLIMIIGNDIDIMDNVVIEYFIVGGDVINIFFLNKDSGWVLIVMLLVFFLDIYFLVIYVIDKGVLKKIFIIILSVKIDFLYLLILSDFFYSIDENVVIDLFVGIVIFDLIYNLGIMIEYMIILGNFNNNFKIGVNDGVVKVVCVIDYEEWINYFFIV